MNLTESQKFLIQNNLEMALVSLKSLDAKTAALACLDIQMSLEIPGIHSEKARNLMSKARVAAKRCLTYGDNRGTVREARNAVKDLASNFA